jgi:hypothetical protein
MSVKDAQTFLRSNCPRDGDGNIAYGPDEIQLLEGCLAEAIFLFPDEPKGKRELLSAHPFAAMGRTPEDVFEPVYLLTNVLEDTVEMIRPGSIKTYCSAYPEGSINTHKCAYVYRQGEDWEDFKAARRVVRAFTNYLPLTDGSVNEDDRIATVMRSMVGSMLALKDDPSAKKGNSSPEEDVDRTK